MKDRFQKVLSVICIMTMLLSCISGIGAYASDDVKIITAQFLPYDQEVRVLADIPEGYEAKLLIADSEIACTATEQTNGTLLASTNFVPSTYGVVPVTVEASNGSNVIMSTQNVEFTKAFSTAVSYSQDFNSLDEMTMASASDNSVVTAVNALGQATLSAVPHATYEGRFADITKSYTTDGSSALTMRFHATADRGLPTLKVDPATDGTNGIIELSYDFYTNNPYIRQTIYPRSRAYSSLMTYTTQDGISFDSTFQVANYDTFCFGSTDKPVEANTWYNVRFLVNLNALTFELYINNELINYGTFTYNDERIGQYIYGIGEFSLAASAQGKAGASEEEPVNVTFDNIKVTHTNTGASVRSLSYTTAEGTVNTDISDAKIPSYASAITAGFDNAIVCDAAAITLQKADGTAVEADVTLSAGDALSAKANRSLITVAPKQVLSAGEYYKIVLPATAKFGSTAYGADIEIPFLATGSVSFVSPAPGTSAKLGDTLNIKAYTPDCTYGELYINDEYVATLSADSSEFMSYQYNTATASAGKKDIKIVLTKNDDTTVTITTNATLSYNTTDIVPLETFENEVASDYFTVIKQASASSAAMSQSVIGGRNAAAFNFVGGTGTNRKVIQVQQDMEDVYTGRVVLEFDMYLAYENRTAELSMSFGDSAYTFYPLDIAKQFTKGKIGGNTLAYYGWHKVKLVMDTVDQSSQLYFDGVQIGDTCYTFDNTYHKADVADPTAITGFNKFTISLWQGQAYTNGEEYLGFAVDNWHIYQENFLPMISDATIYDSQSNNADLAQNALTGNDITKFELSIVNSKYANTSSLTQNFKVLANGEEVGVQNTAIADGIFTFDVAALPENADIELVIGAETLSYDNITEIGSDSVFGFKTADANGLYSKRSISVDNEAKAIFTLDALSEKTVTIIVASYNGNKLQSVIAQPVTVDTAKNLTLSLPVSDVTDVKAFVWSGMGNALPISAGEVSVQISLQN